MKVAQRLESKLKTLNPVHLEIVNESFKHNIPQGAESHFKVTIASSVFEGKSRIEQHRMVNSLLAEELQSDVHALSLKTLTADKWSSSGGASGTLEHTTPNLIAHAHGNGIPKPSIPNEFHANVFVQFTFYERPGFSTNPVHYRPAAFSSTRGYDLVTVIDIFRQQTITWRSSVRTNASYLTINGQCRQALVPKRPLWPFSFGPAQNITYRGRGVHDGRVCNVWDLGDNRRYASMVTDGSPVLFVVANNSASVQSLTFRQVTPVARANLSLDCPAPFYCPAGPHVDLEMLRLHPTGNFSLDNMNTADWIGESDYLCQELLGTGRISASHEQISLYRVRVNSTFGQYAQCSDEGVCNGALMDAVGHEQTHGIGVNSGQCVMNSSVGSWYSLPRQHTNATWQLLELVKTVSVDCLLKAGLQNACKQEFSYPFSPTVNLLKKAFSSSMC